MIFLGAGSSKVFGLKTMQDLSNDLVSELRKKGHSEAVDQILRALKRFGLTADFENIYTPLESLVNPEEGIRKSGAFTAYLAYLAFYKDFKKLKARPEYKRILSDFRTLIYEECTIRRGVIKRRGSVFDKLSEAFTDINSELRFVPSRTGSSVSVHVKPWQTIVTTNYDMAVEFHHWERNRSLINGFRDTENPIIKELNSNEYASKPEAAWLIKLHGSIWQFNQGDRIIQTVTDPEDSPLEISVGEQMMIYPVGEKPILRDPYYSFYSLFKEQPWNILVAIGYSFRDTPVNTAILDRLETRPSPVPKPRLIVVNPDPEKVIENLVPLPSDSEERIIPVQGYFDPDNEELFAKIKLAIESSNREKYKNKVIQRYGKGN